MASINLALGHGTENSFVLVLEDGGLGRELSSTEVSELCSKFKQDAFIRMHQQGDGQWFMDYRNGDGSVAEMCGNGIRVMAHYLYLHGKLTAKQNLINTRDGEKLVSRISEAEYAVEMGLVQRLSGTPETKISTGGSIPGMNISVGNPHAVFFVDSVDELEKPLSTPQVLPPDLYPDGVNVEFVEFLRDNEVRMRVHERGVGETRSCGTGACAVAFACAEHLGRTGAESAWLIHVPGGVLKIELDVDGRAVMTGPAVVDPDMQVPLEW